MTKADYIKILAVVISAAVFLVSCGGDKARKGLTTGDNAVSQIINSERASARVIEAKICLGRKVG